MKEIHDKPVSDTNQLTQTTKSDSGVTVDQTASTRRASEGTYAGVEPKNKSIESRSAHKAAMNALSIGKYESAVENFKKAADLGNADAMYQLALLYTEGKGVVQSDAEKLNYLKIAADLGHDEASFMLADIYSKDPQKADMALALYQTAAEQEHPGAQLRMAEISFAKGDFIAAKDFATKAKSFFEDVEGLYLKDTTTDVGEQAHALQKSNYMQANLILGKIHLQEGNDQEALLSFEKATSAENPNSTALRQLGIIYSEGMGTQINYDKAIDCLLDAYMASDYDTTDGTIAQLDIIVDRLMQEAEPETKVSEDSLRHLKMMYSGSNWHPLVVLDNYDTVAAVQQSIANNPVTSKPSMANYKKSLECSLLMNKNNKDGTKNQIQGFFWDAMRDPISPEKSETLLWLAHIYNDGVLVPRNARNALLCLLYQENLNKDDQILLRKIFPEVKKQQDEYRTQIKNRSPDYYDIEHELIENNAHESIVQKYNQRDREFSRSGSMMRHTSYVMTLKYRPPISQTSINQIPRESLNMTSADQKKLEQLNVETLKRILNDPYLTDSHIDELLKLMYEKCPALMVPDSAYNTKTLISLSRESIPQLTQDLKNSPQKNRAYEDRIKRDNRSFQESQIKYKGKIPFSDLESEEPFDFTQEEIEGEIMFLKGEETQTQGGVGSSMHLNNRPQKLILDHVKPGDAYLDIGCGAGSQSYELLKKGATVVMNDPDARSLMLFKESAQGLIPKEELDQSVNFSYGYFPDATKDIPDASFDGIVCNHVMHYTNPEQIHAMFAEMNRLLKPGGRIHIDAISPFHSYLFQFATASTLEKMEKGDEWPSELKDTNQIFTQETGLEASYNTAKQLPSYMHPQFSEVLAREASNAKLTIQESGYAPFFTEGSANEHSARKAIMRSLLEGSEEKISDLLSLPFEDKGMSYIMAIKPLAEGNPE